MTRIAVAGAGAGGALHASAAASLAGTDLVAVSATTAANAEYLAVQADTLAVGTEALPAGADAVVVATTTASHLSVALPLVEKRTPVLVEKPLAATLADGDRLIAAAEASGSLACYAENLLFAPVIDATLDRLQILGEVTNLEIRFRQPAPDVPTTGTIATVGPSAIALALLYGGNATVEALRCRAESSRADGLDETARLELRFSSRVIAVLDIGWTAGHVEWSTQVASADTVLVSRLAPESALEVNGTVIDFGDQQVRPEADRSGSEEGRRLADLGFVGQMKGFVTAASGKGGRVCPAGFGQLVMEIVYAAYRSAASGGDEIALPYDGDRAAAPDDPWLDRPTI